MGRRNPGIILGTSAFAILLGLATAPARADDMFLQLGDVVGDATKVGYEKWIEVLSWSWGASNPTTVGAGAGLSAGKVSVSDLSLMKVADSATPRLIDAVANGVHFPKAALAIRRSSDRFEYMRIRLEEVMVSSDQLSAGGERPTESVSLSFARYVVDYTPGPGQKAVSFGWDVARNVPFSPAP
jgi:type VI secretion system secreted protein Hcp